MAGLLAGLTILSVAASQVLAVDKNLVNKGEILLEKNCSRCHAIGKEGDSPQSASAAVLDPVQQVPHR